MSKWLYFPRFLRWCGLKLRKKLLNQVWRRLNPLKVCRHPIFYWQVVTGEHQCLVPFTWSLPTKTLQRACILPPDFRSFAKSSSFFFPCPEKYFSMLVVWGEEICCQKSQFWTSGPRWISVLCASSIGNHQIKNSGLGKSKNLPFFASPSLVEFNTTILRGDSPLIFAPRPHKPFVSRPLGIVGHPPFLHGFYRFLYGLCGCFPSHSGTPQASIALDGCSMKSTIQRQRDPLMTMEKPTWNPQIYWFL